MKAIAAILSGFLFGVGLIVSGMTTPAKVVGFLDFFGEWDPTLAFVMGGAVSVYAAAYRLVRRRARPLLEFEFDAVDRTEITARLIVGSALFGIGWGLSGFCPGPSLVALGSGSTVPIVFVLSMSAGMVVQRFFEKRPEP